MNKVPGVCQFVACRNKAHNANATHSQVKKASNSRNVNLPLTLP
jgi:hypothetical protein